MVGNAKTSIMIIKKARLTTTILLYSAIVDTLNITIYNNNNYNLYKK